MLTLSTFSNYRPSFLKPADLSSVDSLMLLSIKIEKLFNQIVLGTIDDTTPTNIPNIMSKFNLTFFRRHPLADYPDPGNKPLWIRFSAQKKWRKKIESLLPKQLELRLETAFLECSKLLFEKQYKSVQQELSNLIHLSPDEPRLRLIFELAKAPESKNKINLQAHKLILQQLEQEKFSKASLDFAKDLFTIFREQKENSLAEKSFCKVLQQHIFSTKPKSLSCFSPTEHWLDYMLFDQSSILLVQLIEAFLENLKILQRNQLHLNVENKPVIYSNLEIKEKSISWMECFFKEVLIPKSFKKPQDEWHYLKNICRVRLMFEWIKAL